MKTPSKKIPAAADPIPDCRRMGDEELFGRLSAEKSEADRAFAELYARHSARVWAYCRCVFGDAVRAEDVFQDTFARFFERGQQKTHVRNVPAYLLITARNLCLNAKRDTKPSISIEDLQLTVHDRPFENRELLELVNTAMALLPAEQREAFFLREYEDLSYDDIGGILSCTALSARIRVSRARKKLREILHPYVVELTQP
ncbi:MAG: RNA polymerase sigma factor [Ignavibacteriae bacterium]|nr:RNA polymerase sigma factor [Ignavibacteriota bacterium]